MSALIRYVLARPVAVAAAWMLVVVLAAVAVVRLPVALFPSLDYPALTVYTTYPGATPERVEEVVTVPVEREVAGTDGVVGVEAESRLGASVVRLQLTWDADPDLALLAVRERLDRLSGTLPDAVGRPNVFAADPGNRPVLSVALLPDSGAPFVSGPVAELVARRLEQLEGVARVRVIGADQDLLAVRLRPRLAAAYGVDAADVERALASATAAVPGGLLQRGATEYAVEVGRGLDDAEAVRQTEVVTRRGTVPLARVAEVAVEPAPRRGQVRFDGAEAVLLYVEKGAGANTVRVAERARDVLAGAVADVGGVRTEVVVDQSEFVVRSFRSLGSALATGGVLAVLVLALFLRRLGPLVAVGAAVPLSVAAALALFEPLGMSLNLMSLSGLTLGVGMLLDNAIIVSESITRYRDGGLPLREAVARGTAEVAGAIAASTATTVVVFLPLAFVGGLTGRLFREQSLAVVCSLGASLAVALTAVPLLVRAVEGRARRGARAPAPSRAPLVDLYERGLVVALRRPALTLAAAAAVSILGVALLVALPREVVPVTPRAEVAVTVEADPADGWAGAARGAALAETAARQAGASHVLSDIGEQPPEQVLLAPRPAHVADLVVLFPDTEAATAYVARADALDEGLAQIEIEARPAASGIELLLPYQGSDIQIDLPRGEGASAPTGAVLTEARRRPELVNIRRAVGEPVPVLEVTWRRRALAAYDLRPDDVLRYAQAAAGGLDVGRLEQPGRDVPVRVSIGNRRTVESFLAARVRTPEGTVPLRVLADVERSLVPAALLRVDQGGTERVLADFADGVGVAEGVRAAQATLDEAGLGPVGAVRGAGEAFAGGARAVAWSLALSVLLVYLLLAAQFNSVVQPVVVLTTVPLALSGVALALALTGQTVNLMSMTGAVLLVGIVVNDAIVKVDLINQRLEAGHGLAAAVISAGADRFRPIVMTTVTTAVGLLPTALGWGEGSALNAPLAIAVVGGILSSTALTLYAVPALYLLVSPQS